MDDQYKNLTEEIIKNIRTDKITENIMARLEEGAKDGKLTITFKDKLSETEYDEKGKKIIFKNKKCLIPPGSLEDELCLAIYRLKKVNEPIEWFDIAEIIEGERLSKPEPGETQWPVEFYKYYDAVIRINKKAKKCFGIKKLIEYKKQHFTRIR